MDLREYLAYRDRLTFGAKKPIKETIAKRLKTGNIEVDGETYIKEERVERHIDAIRPITLPNGNINVAGIEYTPYIPMSKKEPGDPGSKVRFECITSDFKRSLTITLENDKEAPAPTTKEKNHGTPQSSYSSSPGNML